MSPTADRHLVADARDRLAAAPGVVARHSLRMAALANALAARDGLDVDGAGLFCACAFHDLGMGVPGRGPFPSRSADLLAGFLAEHDVPAARARPLVAAVRRHLAPPIDRGLRHGIPAEVTLLRRAAWLDVLGVGDDAARRLRRELREADSDPVLDVRLAALIGVACARDLLTGARGVLSAVTASSVMRNARNTTRST